MKPDVIVIGGGGAGLMCAIEAGKRGRSVLVLEHQERLGKKILISGGGRCNFTNREAGPENYLSNNPHFCKSALARYSAADFMALVERHGIAYHEKKLGQLFCNLSSKQIVEMLEQECRQARVTLKTGCHITQVEKHLEFSVTTNAGIFSSQSLVVATGGLSFANIGATDFGHRLARQFGLKMTQTRPGLVPIKWPADSQTAFSPLSGLSVDVMASVKGHGFRENLLFTHRGLSGPAILQISSYTEPGTAFEIDLLPDRNALELLTSQRQSARELKTVLGLYFPQRFSQAWCDFTGGSRPINQYTTRELAEIAQRLQHWSVTPSGTEGYTKAEVTLGGVDTSELSSKTMESRRVPGLYFVGEVVDVTGWLGGYNFQWAWASGHAAGQFV